MLEYKGKKDREEQKLPYCNHQEFVLKSYKNFKNFQYSKKEFSKLVQKEELSERDHLEYVKLFLDVRLVLNCKN